VIIAAGLAVVFWAGGGMIIDLLAKAPEVQEAARVYLGYMVLAPLLGVAAWMLDGIFIGATRADEMRNMMVISLGAYAVTAALLVPAIGNHGLWLALLVSFVARGVTLGLRYPVVEAAARG
jgi:MATE family multidrug resistance protein